MSGFIHFLRENPSTNAWILYGPYEVYVRAPSFHVIFGERVETFDIANINRPDVENGGKGEFWEMVVHLNHVLKVYTSIKTMYIENVQNPRLAESLPKHGWELTERRGPPQSYFNPPSFFKRVE